jgi:ER membrane protein complex subunit 1
MRFIKRFATGSYESATSSAAVHTTTSGGLPSRDTFGFRQLIILATAHGKIYGMDTSNGKILWSRILGLGSRGAGGDKIVPIENKMFVIKTVGDVNGDAKVSGPSVPEVVVIGQRVLKDVRDFSYSCFCSS